MAWIPMAVSLGASLYSGLSNRNSSRRMEGIAKGVLPDWMNQTNVKLARGSGGLPNMTDLLKSRGKVSTESRDYELAGAARNQANEMKAIGTAAGRAGVTGSGSYIGANVGASRRGAQAKQEIGARHTAMQEGQRRSDLSNFLMPWMNLYTNQLNKRQELLGAVEGGAQANKTGLIQGLAGGISSFFG